MLHTLRNRAQSEKGFTLIELLVVILIIGILAAIAIPAFLGQRHRAEDASAKSAARQAQTAMETYATDAQSYVGADAAALDAIESSLNITSTGNDQLTVGTVTADSYVVNVKSKTGNVFTITKDATTGNANRTCTRVKTSGGCPTGLSW